MYFQHLGHGLTRSQVMSRLLLASQRNCSLNEDKHWLRGDAFALIVAGRYDSNCTPLPFVTIPLDLATPLLLH